MIGSANCQARDLSLEVPTCWKVSQPAVVINRREALAPQTTPKHSAPDFLGFPAEKENCGSLTDASLLCLHAVMEFLSDSDGAKHLEMTPPKVRKAPPRILQPEPEAVASQKPKAQVPTAVKKEQYDEFDVVHERSKTKAPEIDNVQNEFGVVQVYHRRAKKTSLAL